MASEKEITAKQSQSDVRLGLETFEEWQSLSKKYRTRIEEAYGPALKLVLQNLLSLSETGAKTLETYLETFHPTEPAEASPEGKLLRPDVPEWRPGSMESSSSD